MNARQRFLATLNNYIPSRPPLFEDGIRDEVLKTWYTQGLSRHEKLSDLIRFDRREEIEPNLEPLPAPTRWPTRLEGLKKLVKRLDPSDPRRLPADWKQRVQAWRSRDYPLILRLQRGYFLTLGVHGWRRFNDAVQLLVDDPQLVEAWMKTYTDFTCTLAERVLDEVEVDAVLFSEPIGGNHGPLISPAMYEKFVLKSYLPILEMLRAHGIRWFIYRTYANTRVLLPGVVRAGFNVLWACETEPQAMDYGAIRQEFGKDLRLIGGIDADSLRQSPDDIQRIVMKVVPPLLQDGGYLPLADGRVREDVPFQNYLYYRNLLEELTEAR
ncbi:MAG: hypothetical protein C3F13_05370 [Anaerolineales bacterium]|nr:MAG: hypothetical protein C3F13_05370 [Anaerolineales bacterium]